MVTGHYWPAPAKLNLMLHITGRRQDGYHLLQSIFQFIDFADQLKFEPRKDALILRHSTDFAVPQQQDIIVRAAQLLRCRYLQKMAEHAAAASGADAILKSYGVDIYLKKNIPMGAGLGGGSSDAATTLLALNELWDMGFSIDELAETGLSLGADVPVFVRGFAAFAEGIGEKLSPFSVQENWYLLLIPPVHVATREIFCHPQLTRDSSAIKLCDLSRHEWRNDCTPVVARSYPMVSQAIDILGNYSKAMMSGTGSSVFAAFETQAQARHAQQQVRLNPVAASWFSVVAKGLNQSPLHRYLKTRAPA